MTEFHAPVPLADARLDRIQEQLRWLHSSMVTCNAQLEHIREQLESRRRLRWSPIATRALVLIVAVSAGVALAYLEMQTG